MNVYKPFITPIKQSKTPMFFNVYRNHRALIPALFLEGLPATFYPTYAFLYNSMFLYEL